MKIHSINIGVAFLTVAVFGPLTSADAGEWTSESSVSTSATYKQNPKLSAESREENYLADVTPKGNFTYHEDLYEIELAGELSGVKSADQGLQKDYGRYGLSVGAKYFLEKGSLNAGYTLDVDSVMNTEFEDSNVYISNVTKTTNGLSFGGRRSLNDYWGLDFSQRYSSIRFDGGTYTSYESGQTSIGAQHQWSETTTISPSFGYDFYKPATDNSKLTHTYRMNLGTSYELSETESLDVTLGLLKSVNGLGWSVKSSYGKQWESTSLNLSLSRDVKPSSTGGLDQSNSFGANGSYDLFEDWTLGGGSSFRMSKSAGANSGGNNLSASLNPWLRWQINEDVSTRFSYDERYRKSATASTWVTSRTFLMTLTYQIDYE